MPVGALRRDSSGRADHSHTGGAFPSRSRSLPAPTQRIRGNRWSSPSSGGHTTVVGAVAGVRFAVAGKNEFGGVTGSQPAEAADLESSEIVLLVRLGIVRPWWPQFAHRNDHGGIGGPSTKGSSTTGTLGAACSRSSSPRPLNLGSSHHSAEGSPSIRLIQSIRSTEAEDRSDIVVGGGVGSSSSATIARHRSHCSTCARSSIASRCRFGAWKNSRRYI